MFHTVYHRLDFGCDHFAVWFMRLLAPLGSVDWWIGGSVGHTVEWPSGEVDWYCYRHWYGYWWLSGARWGVWVRLASNWNCFKLRKFKLHGRASETKPKRIQSNAVGVELLINLLDTRSTTSMPGTVSRSKIQHPTSNFQTPRSQIRDPRSRHLPCTESCPLYVLAVRIYQTELRVKPKPKPQSKLTDKPKKPAMQTKSQDRKWPKSATTKSNRIAVSAAKCIKIASWE